MDYRVTGSLYRRASFPVGAFVVIALLVNMSLSAPDGASVTNLALFSVLGAWVAAFGVRGWRSATLLASARKVTVRQLVWTISWSWEQIDGFAVETRPVPWTWLPLIRLQRRVPGVRLRDGRVYWLPELTCRPSADGRSWVDVSAARLSELARSQATRAAA